jgi:hypothetical protein
VKAGFSEKLPFLRCSERNFQAGPGCCGKHYATVLDEEHKVSVFALAKDFLIIFVVRGASAGADLHEQAVSVNPIAPKFWFHGISPFEVGAQHLSVTGGIPKNCGDTD